MSLANFFHRAVQSASAVLQGFDETAFRQLLDSHTVAIEFDNSAVVSQEGRGTLQLLTNLLSRLYPRISLLPHGSQADEFSKSLEHIARSINPDIALQRSSEAIAACIIVGSTPKSLSCPALYVGSDGWTTEVSQEKPVGSGDTNNPFGAGAAACFGAANIFRYLFSDQLGNGQMDQSWRFSFLSFERDPSSVEPGSLPPINLKETHLVGLGAVGNATIWALSRVADLEGTLILVDPEKIELSNLQRYVLAFQKDIERPKTSLAVEAFSNSTFQVYPESLEWGDYLAKRNNWHLPLVAVAVDSATIRRAVQAALPKQVVNAWTQPGNLGISRHKFANDGACLMCLYLPYEKQKNFDQLVLDAIQLPQDALMEVRDLLYLGSPLTKALLARIATGLNVDPQVLSTFEGKPLQVFYREAICGGIVLPSRTGDSRGEFEVPLAFQSALSGILLAAEIVATCGNLRREPIPTTTTIDLLKPLGSHFSFAQQKHPSGKCICQDPDFVTVYTDKYRPPP